MATSEGAGNLLDQSCVLASSCVAEGWDHSEFDYPLIVAGRAGGAFKEVGHYRSPSKESLSDVLLACAQAVAPDAGITEIGRDEGTFDGRSTTPLGALLA
jgi:hypothetical protein